MTKLFATVLFTSIFVLGCTKNNSPQYVGAQIFKPSLDWQKGTESVLRGIYEERAPLDVNMYYNLIAPECDRTPVLPPQIFNGARLITYRNYPKLESGQPAREEELSINKISKVEHSRYDIESQIWSRNSTFIDDSYYSTGAQISKIPVEGNPGSYRADGTWESPLNERGQLPKIDPSQMLEVLKAALKGGIGFGRETFTQGVFHFGNGDVILAIQRLRLVKTSETKSLAEVEIRIPKQPGLYDVNCVAATAYTGRIEFDGTEFRNEDETELLFTSARMDEGEDEE